MVNGAISAAFGYMDNQKSGETGGNLCDCAPVVRAYKALFNYVFGESSDVGVETDSTLTGNSEDNFFVSYRVPTVDQMKK